MIIFADHFGGYVRNGLQLNIWFFVKTKSRRSSAVEHVICNLGVGGPNPSAGSVKFFSGILMGESHSGNCNRL